MHASKPKTRQKEAASSMAARIGVLIQTLIKSVTEASDCAQLCLVNGIELHCLMTLMNCTWQAKEKKEKITRLQTVLSMASLVTERAGGEGSKEDVMHVALSGSSSVDHISSFRSLIS